MVTVCVCCVVYVISYLHDVWRDIIHFIFKSAIYRQRVKVVVYHCVVNGRVLVCCDAHFACIVVVISELVCLCVRAYYFWFMQIIIIIIIIVLLLSLVTFCDCVQIQMSYVSECGDKTSFAAALTWRMLAPKVLIGCRNGNCSSSMCSDCQS